jgi:HEPN domain-containing protein
VDRRDLQALSRIRLTEAKALLRLGHHDGAYYLAGYAAECALKACIAKQTMRHEFPDRKRAELSYTHKLEDLVRVANLAEQLRSRTDSDQEFADGWDAMRSWSEQSRYQRYRAEQARALIAAVNRFIRWVRPYW